MYLFPLGVFGRCSLGFVDASFAFPTIVRHRDQPPPTPFSTLPPPSLHRPYCCHPKKRWVYLSIICRTMLFTLAYRCVAHLLYFLLLSAVVSAIMLPVLFHLLLLDVCFFAPPLSLHAPATFYIVCDCGTGGVGICSWCRCVGLGDYVYVCCRFHLQLLLLLRLRLRLPASLIVFFFVFLCEDGEGGGRGSY